jgi:ferrous iron transport protein B
MQLSELQNNQYGIITKVHGRGAFRRRITEMGFVKGKKVKVIKNAPLQDPIQYNILGYEVSLRREEASLIDVVTKYDPLNGNHPAYEGTISDDILKTSAREKGKIINVAFVGNPNAGKTSLFNYASHSREHTGNYSGVTIDSKSTRIEYNDYTFNITDLPGTYSLSAYSPEELFVRDYIIDAMPDIVINVVDASNLERNLYLTTQLIDMDIKVIIALNMYDELLKRKDEFDFVALGKLMGIPLTPTVGSRGSGIKELFDKIINVYNDKDETVRHIHINYGQEVEKSINKIQDKIKKEENYSITNKLSSRFISIKLLEKDNHIKNKIISAPNYKEIESAARQEINRLENEFKEDSETVITDAKYGFIAGALKETYKKNVIEKRESTEIIDAFITHKLFGFPIFLFILWLMFQSTFTIGNYPMEWIEQGVLLLSNLLQKTLPTGPLKALIVDGIIGGVGGVIVFLPNILILFFFISLLEDTGYMARAAFIMDKLMHKIGLHGKSFIPLIMGFGCNVPAIMATRTIENRNNRLLTMLINPFMSCSARLPVYILLIGAFYPHNQGSILFLIYAIGILLAIVVALLFKKMFFKADEQPFVMELPPYRLPTMRSIIKHMWYKGSQYLKKMGGVILIASIIIWALENYPRQNTSENNQIASVAAVENIASHANPSPAKTMSMHPSAEFKNDEQVHSSYLERIGRFIEPVIKPLGFDWRMGVSLLSGIAAKEIVISTMGVIFQVDDGGIEENQPLIEKIRQATYQSGERKGEKLFTPISAFSYILFILIYFPCVAVIAAIKKESGSWKWAVFTIFYTTFLAWMVSFLFYQTGTLITNL